MQAIRKDSKRVLDVDLERKGYINTAQCRFQKYRNTSDALLQFEQDMQAAIARKHHTVAIFFDISKPTIQRGEEV